MIVQPWGKAKPGHNGGAWASGWSLPPSGLSDYDGPETIRLRKYATGTHVLLEEIEVETEPTPREVVWTKNKTRLYRYRRQDGSGGKRRPVPVLLIYGFVLKPYVLDLVPGNSLVEYLVKEGFDVYLLDFGISGLEDAVLLLEDFVLDYMCGAVQKVLETSGAEEISLFGHSQGGTLCTMYASLFPGGPLKNLVLVATPTEFAPRNPGPLGLWTLASRNGGAFFDPAMVPQFFGNLPTDLASQFINSVASLQASAVGTGARPFSFGVYDAASRKAREWAERDATVRSWLTVSKWVDDAVPFPGETFRRWVRDFYQGNKLVKGKVKLRGSRVDLSNIGCAVLNVSGKWDYVVPPSQTEPLPLSPAARIRSPSLWTPGTWACLPGRGPGVASGPVSGTGSCPARVDRGLLASMDLPANPIAPTSRWMVAARAWESGPSLPPVRLPTRRRAAWPRGLPGSTAVAGRGRRAWNVLRYEKGTGRPNGTE